MRGVQQKARANDLPGRFAFKVTEFDINRCRTKGRVESTQLTEKSNEETYKTDRVASP
jgi:hypothetical protein